jgi:hypothetical protein
MKKYLDDNLSNLGASTSDGTCGIQSYLKESGQCACLDSTTTTNTGVSVIFSAGADFCYRTGNSEYISPIHTFVNIPALLLKNTLRFLIRAGIFTKV